MESTADDRKRIADQHIQRAKKSLQSAKELLTKRLYEDSISRAYYSAYHAAYAVLFQLGLDPHTHKGLQNLFYVHIIESGLLPRESMKIFARLMEERTSADYGVIPIFDEEEARKAANQATKFLQQVERLLDELS